MQPAHTVAVRTCHRVEFYSETPFTLAPPTALSSAWNEIDGRASVLRRLATIAVGADSKILGEAFIAEQCRRPFLKTTVATMPFPCIDKTFLLAQRIKDQYQFFASLEYERAAFQLLDMGRESHPKDLVVFGGGILGRSIANHAISLRYERVFVLTRNPSRCEAAIESSHIEVRSYNQFSAPTEADVVIAVHTTQAARKRIEKVLRSTRGGAVVDFSGESNAVNTTLSIQTMHDPSFIDLIERNNSELMPLVPKVRDAIDRELESLVEAI